MSFKLKYINVFDDINTGNVDDIQDFYTNADLRVESRLPTPSFDESQELQQSLSKIRVFSPEEIAKHLESYALLSREVASEISSCILQELKLLVPSENALKSNYGKLAFWAKTVFSGILNDKESNVYIDTELNKYELHMLYIASRLGNNIVIIDRTFDKSKYKLYNNFIFNCSGTNEGLSVKVVATYTFEDIIEGLPENKLGRCKIIIVGEDEDGKLNKLLVDTNERKLEETRIFNDGIPKPSFDESHNIPRPDATSMQQLLRQIGPHMFASDKEFADKAAVYCRKALQNEANYGKAVTKLVTFICSYNRYWLKHKTYIYYGKLDTHAIFYLNFLYELDKTVIVVDTEGKSAEFNSTSDYTKIELGHTVPYHKYPSIYKSTTIAYNASKEIDNTLYTGQNLGLYRDRQYKTCDITVLNTTFDELLILWEQENTVRPSFRSTQDNVLVPVFYTKLMGTCQDYEDKLGQLVTDHTIVCFNPSDIMQDWLREMEVNHFASIKNTMFKEQKPMYKDGKLDIDTIMGYKTFTYKHLDMGVQQHILSKLSMILQENMIDYTGMSKDEYVDILLNVGLNLSVRIQQEMQWYDYTKQSPKLVVLCQDREELTIGQSIVITLLHLCGWDVVICIPTCYNILGNNIKVGLMQEFTLGEPKFNTNISSLEQPIPKEEKKGIFQRLFG